MKLLLDENMSGRHAVRLRESGHDAVAIQSDRVLVTLDADFGNIIRYLHKIRRASSGCVSIRLLNRRSNKLLIAVYPSWVRRISEES